MTYLYSAYAIILIIVFGYIIRVNLAFKRTFADVASQGIKPARTSNMDKPALRYGLTALTTILLFVGLYLALVWSPDAEGEPPTYRILYFHVSVAIMAYLGFFITFLGGALYLWKKDLRFDRWAKVGADLGIHFSMLMIVTGMIWGKQRWGAWWIWEPRLTTALILLIIYVGYLILRHVLDNPVTRARYAAVYGIIAFIDVPMVRYAIKFWGSVMHPVVMQGKETPGLSQDMLTTLYFSEIAFIVTFFTMYLIRLRVDDLDAEIEAKRAKEEEGE
ncbi:MAG: cytochrome c biogenesis protein [Nitrospinota bacterium]